MDRSNAARRLLAALAVSAVALAGASAPAGATVRAKALTGKAAKAHFHLADKGRRPR